MTPMASRGRALTDLEVLVLTQQLRLRDGRGRRALLELKRYGVDKKEKLQLHLLHKHDDPRHAPVLLTSGHTAVSVPGGCGFIKLSAPLLTGQVSAQSIYRRREKLRFKHNDLVTRPRHTGDS